MYKLIFLIFLSFNAFAKDYVVKATITGGVKEYSLQQKLGENYHTIQTQTITNEIVKFTLTDKNPKGYYKIYPLDLSFIFNHQDVELKTTAEKSFINTKILKDGQNKDFYEILFARDYDNARSLVVELLNYYPEESYFYQILVNQNNYLFANDFTKTSSRIIKENKPYNHLLIRKIKDNDSFKALKQQFKDSDISLDALFKDFIIDDFAVYSNMLSNRLNFYLFKAFTKTDEKETRKQNVLQAKDELLEFFKDNQYLKQIEKIISDILNNADLD